MTKVVMNTVQPANVCCPRAFFAWKRLRLQEHLHIAIDVDLRASILHKYRQ